MSRFRKGQSGNPNGRPRKRRPDVSAFDILFDKRLTVTQGGKERELTVDEALQMQTYQAALKGSRMAIRKVLRMIEKREVALAKKAAPRANPVKVEGSVRPMWPRAATTASGRRWPENPEQSLLVRSAASTRLQRSSGW